MAKNGYSTVTLAIQQFGWRYLAKVVYSKKKFYIAVTVSDPRFQMQTG